MRKITLLLGLLFAQNVIGQTHTTTHTVSRGETLYQIAKKYDVTVQSIVTINPETADGIKEEQVIKIPKNSQLQHTVQPKETLYGLSKQYNIAIEKLYEFNPGLKENGLKEGQTIFLTKNNSSAISTPTITTVTTSSSSIKTLVPTKGTHTVEKGETLFSISRKYNVAISYLYEWNPILNTQPLQEGQVIQVEETVGKPVTMTMKVSKTENFTTVVVEPKETLYNIQKTYNVSYEELLKHNSQIANGLKEGTTLKVPVKNSNNVGEKIENDNKKIALPTEIKTKEIRPTKKLFSGKNKEKRELVLLMPFNLDANNPNSSATQKKLNEDVFLNIAVDFYAGAELALDDLKSKKYALEVKVIDSKESNRSLDINALQSSVDFSNTDVIVGPFFQKNVDALSKKLANTSTVVVSPISTEKGQSYRNQIHTMPNEDLMKSEVLHYLQSKNANIVSVYLPSQTSKINALYAEFPQVKKVSTNSKGNVPVSIIEPQLVKGGKNFVILDADNHLATVEAVMSLKKLQSNYDIQLVTLQKNNHLESTDVDVKDLAQLEMIYPSVTNEENSWKRTNFYKKFNDKYGKNPSKYAVRGYDVVYDVVNRMFSGTDHEDLFDYGTNQVENKFVYIKKDEGVYNSGVYILQYTKDLKIKEAK